MPDASRLLVTACAVLLGGTAVLAQSAGVREQAITRAQAIQLALARGPRAELLRADSSSALARLRIAHQWENPVAGASYSKSAPTQHFSLDLPLDFPWLRRARIGAAEAAAGATRFRYEFDRAALAFEVDTAYTHALAAEQRATLSQQTVLAADSLVVLARLRRDAGDGTELDVQLSEVNAGQAANLAADDSLERSSSLLVLQSLMGMPTDRVAVAVADSLLVPPAPPSAPVGVPLLVAAAAEALRSAELAVTLERRRVYGSASLSAGFDRADPALPDGALPTIGFSIPLPVFNRNDGAVEQAGVARMRAQAELQLARQDAAAQATKARRGLTLALARAARDRRLLDGARRVAALSLLAYREGASSLPSVLEAQRIAREALLTWITDVAAARTAAGLVGLLTMIVTPGTR